MEPDEEQKIYKESWKRINDLIDVRTKQIQDACGFTWWGYLIKDEFYVFLIGELTKLKMNRTQIDERFNVGEEDIKKLASGFVTVEEYMGNKKLTEHNVKGCQCPKGSDPRFCIGNDIIPMDWTKWYNHKSGKEIWMEEQERLEE